MDELLLLKVTMIDGKSVCLNIGFAQNLAGLSSCSDVFPIKHGHTGGIFPCWQPNLCFSWPWAAPLLRPLAIYSGNPRGNEGGPGRQQREPRRVRSLGRAGASATASAESSGAWPKKRWEVVSKSGSRIGEGLLISTKFYINIIYNV